MINQFQLNKKIVASCFLASCLEIYDFVIFAFFVPTLNKNYFIFLDEKTTLIVTYILFAIGFLFRPVGSIIFGYIGDVFGRKKALVTSVSLMGTCSLIMFLLPSYQTMGIAACYIIVLVRIIQGLSVGGEFTGALIFASEHSGTKKVGIVGGIMTAGGASGVLLATIVSNILKDSNLPDYAWRFAFLIGFSLSIVGYIIRSRLAETPLFVEYKRLKKSIPLVDGFKAFKLNSLATIFIAAANGVTFYFAVIFLPNYLKLNQNLDTKYLPIFITILVLIFAPIIGYISDKINRKNLLIVACVIMTLYAPVMLKILSHANTSIIIYLSLALYCLIFSTIASMSNIIAVELFPVEYRMSCTSFFYSIGMGVIGGTVPTISTLIEKNYGSNPVYIGLYISMICFITIISLALAQRSDRQNFSNLQ